MYTENDWKIKIILSLTRKGGLNGDVDVFYKLHPWEGHGVEVVVHLQGDQSCGRSHAHCLTGVVAREHGDHDVEELKLSLLFVGDDVSAVRNTHKLKEGGGREGGREEGGAGSL